VLVGKNRKGEAAGAYGGQKLFGAVGGENEKGVIRRLFQGFKKSVRCLGRREAHPLSL
jgi:hypothetical protein